MVKFNETALVKAMCQIRMRRWYQAEIYIVKQKLPCNTFNNCTLLNELRGQGSQM